LAPCESTRKPANSGEVTGDAFARPSAAHMPAVDRIIGGAV